VLTPDAVFGLAWSGAMHAKRLAGIVENLPHGLNEIYLHPATAGEFAGAAPGYRYAEELAALSAPEVIDALKRYKGQVGGFADFPGPGYTRAPAQLRK
jgi:hypothetical protein